MSIPSEDESGVTLRLMTEDLAKVEEIHWGHKDFSFFLH